MGRVPGQGRRELFDHADGLAVHAQEVVGRPTMDFTFLLARFRPDLAEYSGRDPATRQRGTSA